MCTVCGQESETLSWPGAFFFDMKIQINNKPTISVREK